MSAGEVGSLEKRIRDYLAVRFTAPSLELRSAERISVGWSHETWLLEAGWREGALERRQRLCLRCDPGNALLRELSTLANQYRVLCCLERTGVPTPRPHFLEEDPCHLGAPFLVMEWVEGVCPSPWSREGRTFYTAAAARRVLPNDFTDVLVALHTLDWRDAGLSFLGVPQPGRDFARREIAKWRSLIEASQIEPDPVLIDLLCWLDANAPETSRLSLVHGAYRTGNFLVRDDRITALLDWETAAIGDPMYDVAYVLSDLNREGTDLLSNLVEREAFFRRYEAGTGLSIDEAACRYYEVLYAMRTAAFWMSATGLYQTGRNRDLRLARTAWSIPVVLDRAARLLGY